MNNHVTTSPNFVIRPPQTTEEIDNFFHLQAQIFRPDDPVEEVTTRRANFILKDPDFRSEQLRGAYLGSTLVGNYTLLERTICFGPVHIGIGCINSVCTHPDYRYQGIAATLMREAIQLAEQKQYPLLFLHGLANFYQRFGYTDVCEDIPRTYFALADIPQQSLQGYNLRELRSEDIPAFLKLYQRHYSRYHASFAPARTLEKQEHYLLNWINMENKVLVALDEQQTPQGYLMLTRRGDLQIYEVATENWEATLALLQAHAQILAAENSVPERTFWPLPPTDTTYYQLADHLPVRNNLTSIPQAGWMARPVNLSALFQALLPLWQTRWQERARSVDWRGTLTITIDDHSTQLALDDDSLSFVKNNTASTHTIELTPQAFIQLVFGFRPVTWIARQDDQRIPPELMQPLALLFPICHIWIAGSDHF